jgi:DNA-binding GntR family transcriptional regulator
VNSPLINWQSSEPAEKRTMASQLEARIRQDIINGQLAPGSRLRLKELAEAYDVGVIPLREALSRLASSGFVSAADQKGFSVGRISAAEIADITAARLHIECKALADSIRQGDVESGSGRASSARSPDDRRRPGTPAQTGMGKRP